MRTVVSKVMWVGRATVFGIGLVVTLALLLGIASAALAAVPGDPLKLGKINTINKISELVGSANSAMLKVDNNSGGPNATALDLRVEQSKPPMSVNSTTKVQGLNVDSLDGKNSSDFLQESSDRDDFFSGKTYTKLGAGVGIPAGQSAVATASCDSGDVALSGGYNFGIGDHSSVSDVATSGDPYSVSFRGPAGVLPRVTCADFPPLRP